MKCWLHITNGQNIMINCSLGLLLILCFREVKLRKQWLMFFTSFSSNDWFSAICIYFDTLGSSNFWKFDIFKKVGISASPRSTSLRRTVRDVAVGIRIDGSGLVFSPPFQILPLALPDQIGPVLWFRNRWFMASNDPRQWPLSKSWSLVVSHRKCNVLKHFNKIKKSCPFRCSTASNG